MSGVYTKINGQFVLSQINSKYLNNYRDTFQIYYKNNNNWNKVYNYFYTVGNWGECSKPCGGGTQTRTVICSRSDGINKSDNYCRKAGINKPETVNQCNTHSCFPASPSSPVYKGLHYTQQKFYWVDLGSWYSRYIAPEAGTYRVYMKAHLVYAGGKLCIGCTGCDGSGSRHPGQFVVFIEGKTNRGLCGNRCCTDYGYWGNCYLGYNGLATNSNSVQVVSRDAILDLVLGEVYLNANETFNLHYYGRVNSDNDSIDIEYDGPNFLVWATKIG